ATFESPHAYNKEMREAMYGWMARWLKGEGKGEPIPEPEHRVETWEDLACFPDPAKDRPKGFLLLPEFAHREGTALVKKCEAVRPKHVEDWEARATLMRATLKKQLSVHQPDFVPGSSIKSGEDLVQNVEPLLAIRWSHDSPARKKNAGSGLFLHFD